MARKDLPCLQFTSVWIYISLWIIFAQDFCVCESVAVDIEVSDINGATLTCTYPSSGDRPVRMVKWSRETDDQWETLAMYSPPNLPVFANAGIPLKHRVVLLTNDDKLILKFRELECRDDGLYKCTVIFNATTKSVASMRLHFTGEDTKISALDVAPDRESFFQGELVTFTCWANLGKPPGEFYWYIVYENGNTDNVTTEAHAEYTTFLEENSPMCQKSLLVLRMDKEFSGAMVQCRVFNSMHTMHVGAECHDFCLETYQLKVAFKGKPKTSAVAVSTSNKDKGYDSQTVAIASVFAGILITMGSVSAFAYNKLRKPPPEPINDFIGLSEKSDEGFSPKRDFNFHMPSWKDVSQCNQQGYTDKDDFDSIVGGLNYTSMPYKSYKDFGQDDKIPMEKDTTSVKYGQFNESVDESVDESADEKVTDAVSATNYEALTKTASGSSQGSLKDVGQKSSGSSQGSLKDIVQKGSGSSQGSLKDVSQKSSGSSRGSLKELAQKLSKGSLKELAQKFSNSSQGSQKELSQKASNSSDGSMKDGSGSDSEAQKSESKKKLSFLEKIVGRRRTSIPYSNNEENLGKVWQGRI